MGAVDISSAGLLLERLRWPVPRVRWEAARALAGLIRRGHTDVYELLVSWTSKRTLESECLLSLCVIFAFELEDCCSGPTTRQSVSKPSLTSDWMLNAIYPSQRKFELFRYTVSPRTRAGLATEIFELFTQINTKAVPPIFLHNLQVLEREHDFAFVDRWKHDWSWICRTTGEVPPKASYFIRDNNMMCNNLHLPQGEKLASAYLRTLAYALHIGKLLEDEAQYYALLTVPLSRGLASMEPVSRPSWSQNLLERWRTCGRKLIADLWSQAKQGLQANEIPANIYLVEVDDKDFIEIDIEIVLGNDEVYSREPIASAPDYNWVRTGTGSEWGDIRLSNGSVRFLKEPMTLTCFVVPRYFGRIDTYLAVRVKLACFALGMSRGRVRCTTSDVELRVGSEVISRWNHWYGDWEPSMLSALDTNVSGMASVKRMWLKKYIERRGTSVAILARVRNGTREQIYKDHEVDESEFWIAFQDRNNFVLRPVLK